MKTAILTLFALLLPGTLMAKATLTLDGASTDSTITINYVVPESSHVQVMVSSLGVYAAPQYGIKAPGNYSIVLNRSGFTTGSYTVRLIMDRDRKKVTRRRFLHSASGRPVTKTREEVDHWNRSFAVSSFSPTEGVELWNEFLALYPDYVDRGLAFVYSIIARVPATDSIDVHAAADSATALLPHSSTYYTIGRILVGLDGHPEGRYPRSALAFANRAVSRVADVPEPYRNEALFKYRCLNGHCLQLLDRFQEADEAYRKAIKILDSMEGYGTYSDFGLDTWAYRGLASLHERRGRHEEALLFYEKAVKSNARDPELWMALQRNFSLFHGSDEGYVDYSRKLETEMRGNAPSEKYDLVDKPLPGFELERLGGDAISLDDIRGNVIVLNFWAIWCGPCLAELPVIARLARETSANDVRVVAVHTPREDYPGIKREEFPAVVRKAVNKHDGSFDTVWDNKEQNLCVRTGIKSLPVTLVADKAGIVRYRMVGFDPENAYRRLKAVVDSLRISSATPR